jgi:protein-S-isoprenylcysteine O-methyltransferase Ste14
MLDSSFQVIYLIEFVIISVVRGIHTRPYRRLEVADDRKTVPDLILLAVAGVAMLVPLVYLFSSALDFANYTLPDWAGWLGAVIFALGIWVLWRSHADLGLGFREDHQLVTDGIYKYIRHPMYAAHVLWGIASALMLHNWIAGWSLLGVTAVQYLMRVNAEEQMMIEQFGDEYEAYMKKTGRFIPRI